MALLIMSKFSRDSLFRRVLFIRDLYQGRRRRQRERQNRRSLDKQTTTLHVHPVLWRTLTQEQRLEFSFPELRCSLLDSTPEKLTNI